MERKTAKYYRDIINKGNITASLKVLPEIIKKFGHKRWEGYDAPYELNIKKYTEFNWNHKITLFGVSAKNGKLYADIYWQGDSTDGDTTEYASDLINGKTIPAEHEFIGGRTYYRHDDLRISREEFADAVKAVAEYLSPAEIKARKERDRRAELNKRIYDFVAEQTKDRDEYYWNGRYGVQKVLETNPSLYDLSWEELKPIILKVYNNNAKSDYYLRGGWCSGEKKYNLAY